MVVKMNPALHASYASYNSHTKNANKLSDAKQQSPNPYLNQTQSNQVNFTGGGKGLFGIVAGVMLVLATIFGGCEKEFIEPLSQTTDTTTMPVDMSKMSVGNVTVTPVVDSLNNELRPNPNIHTINAGYNKLVDQKLSIIAPDLFGAPLTTGNRIDTLAYSDELTGQINGHKYAGASTNGDTLKYRITITESNGTNPHYYRRDYFIRTSDGALCANNYTKQLNGSYLFTNTLQFEKVADGTKLFSGANYVSRFKKIADNLSLQYLGGGGNGYDISLLKFSNLVKTMDFKEVAKLSSNL